MHQTPQTGSRRVRGGGDENHHPAPPEPGPRSRFPRRQLHHQVAGAVAGEEPGLTVGSEVDPDAVAALAMLAPLVVPPIAAAGIVTAFDPPTAHLIAVRTAHAVRSAVETRTASL